MTVKHLACHTCTTVSRAQSLLQQPALALCQGHPVLLSGHRERRLQPSNHLTRAVCRSSDVAPCPSPSWTVWRNQRKATVDLHGVRADDLSSEPPGHLQREPALPSTSRSGDDNDRILLPLMIRRQRGGRRRGDLLCGAERGGRFVLRTQDRPGCPDGTPRGSKLWPHFTAHDRKRECLPKM